MKTKLSILLSAILILTMTIAPDSRAQDPDLEKIKKNLTELLGANNVGKDFWISNPPCYEETNGNNFVKIFVTSPTRTLVTVEVPGKGHFVTKMTVPDQVIVFDLPPSIGQPIPKATNSEAVPEKVYRQFGVHIYAEDPIVCYCVVRFQATSDGYLCIPVSAIGKEYIVAAYNEDPMFKAVWNIRLPSTTCIVAAHDNTRVRFTMGGNYLSQTAGGLKPGQSAQARLNKGDVWMFMSKGDNADLTGSRIVANNPVSVISGNQCTNIPVGNQWCDYTVEMQLPTCVWGKHYHVAKIPGRKYPSLIRVFAKETETKIYRNGNYIGYIPNVGGVEGKGFQEMRLGPMTPYISHSAVISGDKPIGVTLYNCGVQEDGYPLPNSDPFIEVQTPIEQYQHDITFCTPATFGGAQFGENYLNVVYETDEFGMVPKSMEWAEISGPNYKWTKVRNKFPGADELFSYDVDGRQFGAKTIVLPTVGTFKLRCEKPFAAYSFGYDWCDSYGYPTSAALADLEKPDTIPPEPPWFMDCYGDVNSSGIVKVTDKPDDNEIRSNLAKVLFFKDSSYNYEFWYNDFIPGVDWTTEWGLKIKNPEIDARALIAFADRRGNDTLINVRYYAIKLDIIPHYHDYGQHKVGDESVYDFKVLNLSENGEVKIVDLKLKKNDQNFELFDYPPLPHIIPPLGEMPFKCRFYALESGKFRDSIGVGDTCFFWNKALVEAKVGEPVINADDWNYGITRVGNTLQHEFAVWNTGETKLVITGYDGPSNSAYFLTDMIAISESEPLILMPNEHYRFNVNFTPLKVQLSYPDQIVFHSDAREIDSVCIIDGGAVEPGLLSANYDWGYRRINTGPFPCEDDGQQKAIYLENNGSMDVKINNIIIVDDYENRGSAFEFDKAAFNNLIIEDSTSIVIPVTFNPVELGLHEVTFRFDNNAESPATCTLKGIGKFPAISTNDSHFGTMIVLDEANPNLPDNVTVFTNVPQSDPVDGLNVSDTLTISDLIINPAGGISDDGTTWGSEGFRFDKNNIRHSVQGVISADDPIVLAPNESVQISPADFVAQRNGAHAATISAVSDAEPLTTSNWDGEGLMQDVICGGGETVDCVDRSQIIDCFVQNTGNGDITVDSVEFDPPRTQFQFVNPDIALGFDLVEGERKDFQVLFSSSVVETNLTTELVFKNSTLFSPEIRAEVRGTTHFYPRTTSSSVSRSVLEIGDLTDYSFILNSDPAYNDLSEAEIRTLFISVVYNTRFLGALKSEIEIGAGFKDKFQIQDGSLNFSVIDEDLDLSQISFYLESKKDNDGNYLHFFSGYGELLSIKFKSFLPWEPDQDGKAAPVGDVVDIEASIEPIEGKITCLSVEGTTVSVEITPGCVYITRQLVIPNAGDYALREINPNPIGAIGGNIDFTVGLQCHTEISIFDSRGVKVVELVNKELTPGDYTAEIPIAKMASGVYLCKMQSGPYSATQNIVVAK